MHAHSFVRRQKKVPKVVVVCVTNDGPDDRDDDAKHAKNESGTILTFCQKKDHIAHMLKAQCNVSLSETIHLE